MSGLPQHSSRQHRRWFPAAAGRKREANAFARLRFAAYALTGTRHVSLRPGGRWLDGSEWRLPRARPGREQGAGRQLAASAATGQPVSTGAVEHHPLLSGGDTPATHPASATTGVPLGLPAAEEESNSSSPPSAGDHFGESSADRAHPAAEPDEAAISTQLVPQVESDLRAQIETLAGTERDLRARIECLLGILAGTQRQVDLLVHRYGITARQRTSTWVRHRAQQVAIETLAQMGRAAEPRFRAQALAQL